jgi:hypothetical protein
VSGPWARSGCPFPEHHGGHSGGGNGLAVAALLVIIVAAAAGPLVRAAVAVLEIAAVVGAVLVLALVALALVIRSRRRHRPFRPAVLTVRQERPEFPARQSAPAIESPRNDVATYPRAHADAHVVTSRDSHPRCARRSGKRL